MATLELNNLLHKQLSIDTVIVHWFHCNVLHILKGLPHFYIQNEKENNCFPLERTKHKVKQQNMVSYTGEIVRFTCESKWNVLWTFNKKNLPPNARIDEKDNYLTIENVQTYNEGNYICSTIDGFIVTNVLLRVIDASGK